MLPKLRQALHGSTLASLLVGDSLLARTRSASIALLGSVAAVGLTLVAVVGQIGWPSVVSGPLPQQAGPSVVRNDPIVAPPRAAHHLKRVQRRGSSEPHSVPGASESAPSGVLAVSRQIQSGSTESPQPSQPTQPPAGTPPAGTAPSPAPTKVPTEAESPAVNEPPAQEPATPPPTATASESPGHSGESHGNHYGGGPPSWAGHGSSDSSSGHDSWNHGHDDHGEGWGHH